MLKAFKDKVIELSNKYDFLDVEDVAIELEGNLIEHELIDSTRWHVVYRAIVEFPETFIAVEYGVGATEDQESPPPNTWIIYEVKPQETTVIKYVPVPA